MLLKAVAPEKLKGTGRLLIVTQELEFVPVAYLRRTAPYHRFGIFIPVFAIRILVRIRYGTGFVLRILGATPEGEDDVPIPNLSTRMFSMVTRYDNNVGKVRTNRRSCRHFFGVLVLARPFVRR